jgi:hypothetical protein
MKRRNEIVLVKNLTKNEIEVFSSEITAEEEILMSIRLLKSDKAPRHGYSHQIVFNTHLIQLCH